MKLVTHYVFSFGISLYLISLFRNINAGSGLAAMWLSVSINYFIDLFGHVSRNGTPTRSWVTHSLFTGPTCGGFVAISSISALASLSASQLGSSAIVLWTMIGVIIGESHLLLDSLTESGVYVARKRVALSHFSYDNPALNLGFVLAGVLLSLSSLHQ